MVFWASLFRPACNAPSTLTTLLEDNTEYCSVSHDCKSCNCVGNRCRAECNRPSSLTTLLNGGEYCTVSHDCKSCNCSGNRCTPSSFDTCNWTGWDNDNGQSRIIGCRRRRYYRYKTSSCNQREEGND